MKLDIENPEAGDLIIIYPRSKWPGIAFIKNAKSELLKYFYIGPMSMERNEFIVLQDSDTWVMHKGYKVIK